MLVVDASVIAPAVADGGPDGDVCRARVKGQSLAAPDLLRVEAMSVIRRQLANGALTASQATNAIEDLLGLPIVVYPTAPLLRRGWELRRRHRPARYRADNPGDTDVHHNNVGAGGLHHDNVTGHEPAERRRGQRGRCRRACRGDRCDARGGGLQQRERHQRSPVCRDDSVLCARFRS